jgi:cyclohexanecarboxyl-CoA dehydrogenase
MAADIALSLVRTDSDGIKGLTAMLIPLDTPDVKRLPVSTTGLLLSAPALLRFEGTKVPLKYRIGSEGEGFRVNAATGLFGNLGRIISGLISLGVAQTAMRLAIRYSRERSAFGRPLAKFEALSNKMAEDLTFLEAGRWLCYRALSLKDRGLPHTKEAAMCGWWCPRTAYQTIQDSLLIHGHAGYCDDHPFQQMLRDIVAFEMVSGTEQMLKLIVSHEAIGPIAVPDGLTGYIGGS